MTPTSYCARDNYTLFQLQREFFKNAVTAPISCASGSHLRLSQLFVTSGTDINQAYAMQRYQQMLADLAFGNFKDVLTRVTLSPAMGNYLDMVNNQKPNANTGVEPNENYAREVLQLFSIGTIELQPDGTPAAGRERQDDRHLRPGRDRGIRARVHRLDLSHRTRRDPARRVQSQVLRRSNGGALAVPRVHGEDAARRREPRRRTSR